MTKLVIEEEMTLEEKLKAVDKAIKQYQIEFNQNNGRPLDTPIDPALATICEGCQ